MFVIIKAAFLGLSLACLLCVLNANGQSFPPMPEPVANNAVAYVETQQQPYVLSFMGLGANKLHVDVHNKVWAMGVQSLTWKQKTSVPSSLPLPGRLASVAVGVKQYAYLFGGYTVAEDHTEISSPDNFRYDVVNDSYIKLAPMPVPVDDAVALSYLDRYIYLISGWHNDGNVNLVQVYDIHANTWQQASPFVGQPVFGHAGGIVGNNTLVCDGVKVVPFKHKRRSFSMETACFSGAINPDNIVKIDWKIIAHPTGVGRYRMAATSHLNSVVFFGGSDNPYNYNGIGYNGQPSEPTDALWQYSFDKNEWKVTKTTHSTMDHRGLLAIGDHLLLLGGMGKNQTVLNTVLKVN